MNVTYASSVRVFRALSSSGWSIQARASGKNASSGPSGCKTAHEACELHARAAKKTCILSLSSCNIQRARGRSARGRQGKQLQQLQEVHTSIEQQATIKARELCKTSARAAPRLLQDNMRLALLTATAITALTPKGARLAGVKSRGGQRSKQRQRPRAPPPPPPPQGPTPKVIGVLDFECTCEENTWSYLHEVIEFPVVLVTILKQNKSQIPSIDAVRPTENATLTDFCKDLTGIDQDQVDDAEPIDTVLHELDAWLRSKDLVEGGARRTTFQSLRSRRTGGTWIIFWTWNVGARVCTSPELI